MTDLRDFLGRLDEDPRLPEVLVLMNQLMARMRLQKDRCVTDKSARLGRRSPPKGIHRQFLPFDDLGRRC